MSDEEQRREKSHARPIRFGILDILAMMGLCVAHFAGILHFLPEFDFTHDTRRVFAAAGLSVVSALGAAYLAYRRTTVEKIERFHDRLGALLFFDLVVLCLLLVPIANPLFIPVGILWFGGIYIWAKISARNKARKKTDEDDPAE